MMNYETQDVYDASGKKTAVRVIVVDQQSRRYQGDVPIAQATTDAVLALAQALGSSAGAIPAVTTTNDATQSVPASLVQTVIAPDVSDGSPMQNPQE